MRIQHYSLDDDLIAATCLDRLPRFRVYQPADIAVVIGKGSNPHIELQVENCVQDEVPIYRRSGGGCAVVLDPGNIIVSAVLPSNGIGNIAESFEHLSQWMISGLKGIGIEDVRREGVSDLAVNDRKIAGACIWNSKDVIYYSASLLMQPRIDLMERYLKHPPKEPEYRRGRSHSDFVGEMNLSTPLRTMETIIGELQHALGAIVGAFN
jgi:lipoate-protein ligase A